MIEHAVPAAPLPRVIAFGEALTDMIRQPDGRWLATPGGAPWNVARVLSGFGVPSAFAGAISREELGDDLWRASLAAGLDPRFIQRNGQPPLLSMVYSTHPPRYGFIGNDSADLHFSEAALPADWDYVLKWAHFGGISLVREPLASRLLHLAERLQAAGKQISYDPNFRIVMDATYDPVFRRMCQLADVIKVSTEDLCGLFRRPDPEYGIEQVRAWAPDARVLVTNGHRVAALYQGSGCWEVQPPDVVAMDTIGAGDAAMAGLIHSILGRDSGSVPTNSPAQPPGRSNDDHLRRAIAAGSAACMVSGAAAPAAAVVDTLARQMQVTRVE